MADYRFRSDLHPTLKDIYDDVLVWVNRHLKELKISPITKLHSIHNMAWSVVAKVEQDDGVWYFKALTNHIQYELDVTMTLDKMFSGNSVVIGSKLDCGFLLLRDLGTNLYDYKDQNKCFDLWTSALVGYSKMQGEIATSSSTLSETLPNRELNLIASQARPIIESCINIEPRECEKPVTPGDVEWIKGYFQKWDEVVSDINTFSIPNSIHHGDVHGANIAVNDRVNVFDWGDSSWSHPFVTYLVSEDALQSHLKIEDSSTLIELQEAYLEPWLKFRTMDELKLTLELLNKISPLVMLLSWAYATGNKADERNKEWEGGLVTWTNEFLRLNRP